MSLFPKRTIPGKGVTIHWNFQGPPAGQKTLFPKAFIGVRDPLGKVHVLFNDHLLAFPAPAIREEESGPGTPAFPGASMPLLVLASYLEGRQKRERLVSLLQGMQQGRHFYFHFPVPPLAPPGKYLLISEIRLEGEAMGSSTAEEDFFFVDDPRVETIRADGSGGWLAHIRNPGPETVPALLLEYPKDGEAVHSKVELAPARTNSVSVRSSKAFLIYSEGRELLSLSFDRTPFCLRNQDFLFLDKQSPIGRKISVLHRESRQAYELEGPYAEVWSRAEGCRTRAEIRLPETDQAYDDMLKEGLIRESPPPAGWDGPS